MPRLSKTAVSDLAQFTQQIEILHIARAHLQNIHVGQHRLNLRDLHHFADHEQSEAVAGFAQQFQSVQPQSLERIGRAARLEGAAAQRAGASFGNLLSHREKLVARFHRARAGHHHHFRAADFHAVGKLDHRALRTETSSSQLVRGTDAMNLFDARQHFEIADVEVAARAHCRHHGLPGARGAMH